MANNNETDANPFRLQASSVTSSGRSISIDESSRNRAVSIVVRSTGEKFRERTHLQIDKLEYPRTEGEPGLILIFNQESFYSTVLTTRRGSRRDVNEIVICFQRQGFNVDENNIYTDFKKDEVIAKLKEIAAMDLKSYNSLIIFFLTHGEELNKLFVQDGSIDTREVWNPFRQCKSLDGKPKMFVFQACKGTEYSSTGNSTSPQLQCRSTKTSVPTRTFSTSNLGTDMLVVYSTLEGKFSFRNPLIGSWFIQELCKNFSSYGKRDDVISLIIRTTKCVCGNYYYIDANEEYKKQMPMFVSTLTRKFYLNRNKDRSLLLKIIDINEEILREIKELKDDVKKLLDKKKK